jgi:hypothetical protein
VRIILENLTTCADIRSHIRLEWKNVAACAGKHYHTRPESPASLFCA